MEESPPKLLILPKYSSPNARIITLAHPRTSHPCRYYFDQHHGLYEFTQIAAHKGAYKSWLITSQDEGLDKGAEDLVEASSKNEDKDRDEKEDDGARGEERSAEPKRGGPLSGGYVVKDAKLLVATPTDFLFILLPALCDHVATKSSDSKRLFLSADDLLDKLTDHSKHFAVLVNNDGVPESMETRMQAVCDTVNAGDETMYRLNEQKLLSELFSKARNMVASGLPPSMEDKYIRRALETPIMSVKHEDVVSSESIPNQSENLNSEHPSLDSQASNTSSASASTSISASTDITIPDDVSLSEDDNIRNLLRLRVAFTYMVSSYVPQSLAETLTRLATADDSPIDFKPLDKALAEISKLRAEAIASRSLGDFSRKRNVHEDDDAAETRAEKKRKKELEEKNNKAKETRGLRDLKKVDTKGMKKMSDFFGKGAASKKK